MSAPESQSAVLKPKLRWYQYRLRSLLLLVTLVALVLAAARTWRECRLENLVEGYNRAMESRRYDEAKRYAKTAALLYPDAGPSKLMTWLVDHDKAIADLTEAIRLDPKHAIVYSDRGAAYRASGECDKAIADLTEAIRLDPKRRLFIATVVRPIWQRANATRPSRTSPRPSGWSRSWLRRIVAAGPPSQERQAVRDRVRSRLGHCRRYRGHSLGSEGRFGV